LLFGTCFLDAAASKDRIRLTEDNLGHPAQRDDDQASRARTSENIEIELHFILPVFLSNSVTIFGLALPVNFITWPTERKRLYSPPGIRDSTGVRLYHWQLSSSPESLI
jgi:hypothetical protein